MFLLSRCSFKVLELVDRHLGVLERHPLMVCRLIHLLTAFNLRSWLLHTDIDSSIRIAYRVSHIVYILVLVLLHHFRAIAGWCVKLLLSVLYVGRVVMRLRILGGLLPKLA